MAWRYVLAFVLSTAFLFAWSYFTAPRKPPGAGPGARPAAQPPPPVQAPPPTGVQAEPAAQAPGAKPRPSFARKDARIAAGPGLEVVADSRSGRLSRAYLPGFHESLEAKEPYQLFAPPHDGPGVFTLEIEDPSNPTRPSRIPIDEDWDLAAGADAGAQALAVFRNEVDGVLITKTVLAGEPELGAGEPGPRHLKLRLELENKGPEAAEVTYRLYGPAAVDTESLRSDWSDIELVFGTSARGGEVQGEVVAAPKVLHKEIGTPDRPVAWAGVSNNYFTCVLFPFPGGARADFVEKAFADSIPDPASLAALARSEHKRSLDELDPPALAAIREKAYKNVRVGFRSVKLRIPPGGAVAHEYGLYLGPRDRKVLDRYEAIGLAEVNQYGTFGALVRFFIWLLGILKTAAFGSWGVAIVLLTVLVKLCLHPVNKRSQASMQRFQKKMQAIKPEMDELKQRYANKPALLQKEMGQLMKSRGINPGQQMLGCLLIFLQLPIWYGLYSTLQYAIGLRQSSFLYIEDLTRPDNLFPLGFAVPFAGWTTFNLLPVLYVILTVVQQRLQPKPEDPQMLTQYRMMTFMMVFFGFIFYSFPAGFMLYIMTSAGLGILESKIIKAEIARDEARESAAGGRAGSEGQRAGPVPLYPARPHRSEDGAKRQKGKSRR
ncbi:MAG: YidC/Oxa1 family insertase periplasmic-domain containing protein [Planctomycetes bacterium]|nr:YidC/Oxa1 family insertase periplasmic-domain containing protein [Planctomycetota bacterium]